MSDREAFVSAIAANPDDDLPRLVFADWLDENGEPERAEFIPTQIHWWDTTDEAEEKQLDARAADLFGEHWQRWFGPFLLALDPTASAGEWSLSPRLSGKEAILFKDPVGWESGPSDTTYLHVRRGLLSELVIGVPRWADGASLAEAFRLESPDRLHCRNGLHSPHWARFTDPALRRVKTLTVAQRCAWGVSPPESTAFLEDPHLAGVRSFTLFSWNENGQPDPLPVPWLERFVRSPMAYRLTTLALVNVSADGVVPLCRPGRLHLERLGLGGELSADSVRQLGDSELAGTVQVLNLNSATLGNAGAAALTRDGWQLKCLGLPTCSLIAAILPVLSAAAFTPQLTELNLSDNRLCFDQPAELTGLRALAEVLDPERLEHLNLTKTGLAAVPDYLGERFGERVTV